MIQSPLRRPQGRRALLPRNVRHNVGRVEFASFPLEALVALKEGVGGVAQALAGEGGGGAGGEGAIGVAG